MKLGDIGNPAAQANGKPLDGVRILAAEQMQALPYATQLLARLGAEVVKVEHPGRGENGRGSTPVMVDPQGRAVGSTYLRNNLNKKSVGLDLKHPRGQELFKAMVPKFDVIGENFKSGTMATFGLGYDDIAAIHPPAIYVSVSGFGNLMPSPYDGWPAFAPIAEAMSGIYEYQRPPDQPIRVSPVGALGDTGSAMFATVGVLAALRHRDRTGEGQYVDIAMYDCMVAFADVISNYWSMGQDYTQRAPLINDGFAASDGNFVVQVGREHQFENLARTVGRPEWLTDERFSTREGWLTHLDDVIRPAINEWAADKTKVEACLILADAGVAAGPSYHMTDILADEHVANRNMLVEIPRSDGVEQPVLTPGNPVKLSKVAEGPEVRPAWLGEHTDEVLTTELGLGADDLSSLRAEGVIS